MRIELPLSRVLPERPKSPRVFATWWPKSTLNVIVCVYCWPQSHDLDITSNPEQVMLLIPIRGTRFIISGLKQGPTCPFSYSHTQYKSMVKAISRL